MDIFDFIRYIFTCLRLKFSKNKSVTLSDSGFGTVEVILILVVLIAIVIIFQNQITALVNSIWKAINSSAKTIFDK